MYLQRIILTFTAILVFQNSCFAQIFDLSNFLKETEIVAEETTSQALFEFAFDFKKTTKKDGKESVSKYESVCAEKHCEYVLIEKDGRKVSEKEIAQDRQKAAARLEKSENYSKSDFNLRRKFIVPFDFIVFDESGIAKIIRKNPYFNPNYYLKNCKIDFVEKDLVENRQTVKVSATNCIVERNDGKKNKSSIRPKTEALIWVDEKDKAVIKLEIYGESELSNADKSSVPIVILETVRVPEGFWFWKTITVNTDNKTIFNKLSGDWITEFYNYKKFTVDVKAEVDNE